MKTVNTNEEFVQALESAEASGTPAVVMFFATWCGACNNAKQTIVPDLNMKTDNLVMVNVDDLGEASQICEIRAMPTFQKWESRDGQFSQTETVVGANREKVLGLV